MATPETPVQPRIVVAVDASAASLLALELAADFAAALHATLAGIHVEEQSLVDAAGLACVRRVGGQSGQTSPFTVMDLERQWRAVAQRAQEALARVAGARHVSHSFEVIRGRASEVMPEAARGARLLGFGVGDRAGRDTSSVAQAALSLLDTPLLLAPSQRRRGERWAALIDTPLGASAVLAMAGALAAMPVAPVLLLTPAMEAACQEALAADSHRLARVSLPEHGGLQSVLAALRACGAKGVILAAQSPLGRAPQIDALLSAGGWPALRVI